MCKMQEIVYARAALLAGELEEKQEEWLRFFCGCFTSSLAAQLREGVSVEDCRENFVAAAALYALASVKSMDDGVQEFKAGDLSMKQEDKREGAVRCLEKQAQALMAPYVKDGFSFLGV